MKENFILAFYCEDLDVIHVRPEENWDDQRHVIKKIFL